MKRRNRFHLSCLWTLLLAGITPAADTPESQQPSSQTIGFSSHRVIDQTQGGLTAATLKIPDNWQTQSRLDWNYQDVSLPLRFFLRTERPDGKLWMEHYPNELLYWLEPVMQPMPLGSRSLGMIYHPQVTAEQALMHYVIGPQRGHFRGFRVTGQRTIGNLATILGKAPVPGRSVAISVRYEVNGEPIEEEFYGLLSNVQRIPYHGPLGTTYENQRVLQFVHSFGGRPEELRKNKALLGYVVQSIKIDPLWEQHVGQVFQQLSNAFKQMIAQGYQRIQAAAQLSRTISANNDAMLNMLQQQRQARQRAAPRGDGGFHGYIRGVERMEDPYWGESEQSYHYKYHWTDGFGSYKHSNDPGYNPNQGSSQSWQLMTTAR